MAGSNQKTRNVADALISRLGAVPSGVPAETRAASIDGETTFLRPRPGSARMYPETDIPLIVVSDTLLNRFRKEVPEPWEKLVNNFSRIYELPAQLAEPLYDSDRKELFQKVIGETGLSTTFVASVLVDTFLALSRSGIPVESIRDESLLELFVALKQGRFAKEAVPDILRGIAGSPNSSLDELLKKKGYSTIQPDRTRENYLGSSLTKLRTNSSEGGRWGKKHTHGEGYAESTRESRWQGSQRGIERPTSFLKIKR